jgi:hypothetical protein
MPPGYLTVQSLVRVSSTDRRKRIVGVRFGLFLIGARKNLAQRPDVFSSAARKRVSQI